MTGVVRRAAAAAGIAGILVPLAAVPALAAADPATGYWSRTRLGLLPVEPPDGVPEGGSFVAADPAGAVAVSALRGDADPGNVIVGLRLPIADRLGTPVVLVCPTTERWVPVQGGRLEAAPAADCSAPVEARIDGLDLVVDLPADLQRDLVDVLLAPKQGSSFSLTLEKATAMSLVQAPVTSSDPAPAPGPVSAPPPAGSGFPPVGSGFGSGSGTALPDFSVPAPAVDPLVAAPTLPGPAAVAPVPQPQAAAPAAPVVLATRRPPVPQDRSTALLATALLAGLGALAVRLAVQPAAAPKRLGGAARLTRAEAAPAPVVDSPARGVGRFRAARVRPPVRI